MIKENEQLGENSSPILPTLAIITLALIVVLLYPSASNAMEITVSGALKKIKTKQRPNRKLGHRTHPLELAVLFVIICQFLFFPKKS